MIPNYWKALIKRGDITEKDYFEKVEPCNILIKRAKERLISEFLNDIKYRWNKIISKLTEISENLGLKAEFYFPINDNFGELQKKWEAKLENH